MGCHCSPDHKGILTASIGPSEDFTQVREADGNCHGRTYGTDGSSNRKPPERCPHPLYSRDSTQEDLTIPHHHQGEEVKDIKAEIKEEEEETLVTGDQQFMEEGGPLYSRDSNSTQEDLTIPHHHQGKELEYIKVENKEEEEETLVSGDQQSMEEEERIMEIKKEESSLHMDTTEEKIISVPFTQKIKNKFQAAVDPEEDRIFI
ncbi:uncharacterized protein ACMZJ9_015148 [Mantella aurantiaca]